MAHQSCFRVYYEDTDAGGIVYHARYLAFAERARAEALRSLGMEVGALVEKENLAFIVRGINVRYHAPLRLDEKFCVETSLLEMKASSLTLRQKVVKLSHEAQELSVMLEVELVCIRMSKMKPIRIPTEYRESLQKLCMT